MLTCPSLITFIVCSSWTASATQGLLSPQNPLPQLGDDRSDGTKCRTLLHADQGSVHHFELRHLISHGITKDDQTFNRLDVDDYFLPNEDDASCSSWAQSQLRISTIEIEIEHLQDRSTPHILDLLSAARYYGSSIRPPPSLWTTSPVSAPNTTDRTSVWSFAKMTSDAYTPDPPRRDLFNGTHDFNQSVSFGWSSTGFRGHVYADASNSTVIIAVKGTELFLNTSTQDKINDNLLFACCCGQQGHYLYKKVCDCATDTYHCNSTCLHRALSAEDRYYAASLSVFGNVSALYPNSTIWLTGHSLGGAVASLLGLTVGVPVVTFEAPPQALAASRLGLPLPPGVATHAQRTKTGASHFGNTADPIYMGACNGVLSLCTLAGFAMESQCHVGGRCVYDTVGDKGWKVWVGHHRIDDLIGNVIEVYDEVPGCEVDEECGECSNWYFET